MENIKKYRYPGINSFETTDTDIFFGRKEDRKKLADLVEVEKNVLLYSRSGLGKSSLIKAGLIPELTERGYQSYYIRLGVKQVNVLPPVQNTLSRSIFTYQKQLPTTFLQKFINKSDSLWHAFKTLQIAGSQTSFVLIFDQFEEINSYSDTDILDFKRQLAELISTNIPQNYLDASEDDDLLTEPLTYDELAILYRPLKAKVVFAVRFDQVGVMNKLQDYFPSIQNIFYDLKPLSHSQAETAIINPAKEIGDFFIDPFEYRLDAIQKILASLDTKQRNEIDTAQLQILLQHVEKDIVNGKKIYNISATDLGNLDAVYENYYHDSLIKLPSEQQQQAQILIEEKLIADKKRIQYDISLCRQLVGQSTLDTLVETRLLRQEPNSMDSYSYEVSHDSLVAPILKAREERKREEETARIRKEDEMERIHKEAEEEKLRLEMERKRKVEEEQQKAIFNKQLEDQRKKRQTQLVIIYIAVVAFFISLGFCVWAITERNAAKAANKQTIAILSQVRLQKDSTQTVFKNFITTEIARNKLEREQYNTDIKTYSSSNDQGLVKLTKHKLDSLNTRIDSLNIKTKILDNQIKR